MKLEAYVEEDQIIVTVTIMDITRCRGNRGLADTSNYIAWHYYRTAGDHWTWQNATYVFFVNYLLLICPSVRHCIHIHISYLHFSPVLSRLSMIDDQSYLGTTGLFSKQELQGLLCICGYCPGVVLPRYLVCTMYLHNHHRPTGTFPSCFPLRPFVARPFLRRRCGPQELPYSIYLPTKLLLRNRWWIHL